MNKMKEVAELLGVQLNEEFCIKEYSMKYRITDGLILCAIDWVSKRWSEIWSNNDD